MDDSSLQIHLALFSNHFLPQYTVVHVYRVSACLWEIRGNKGSLQKKVDICQLGFFEKSGLTIFNNHNWGTFGQIFFSPWKV